MRYAAVALALLYAVAASAACPVIAPGNFRFSLSPCSPVDGTCPNGPVSFELVPQESGGFPPAFYDPGYRIQSCDSVTWEFGDGTTQTVVGPNVITHDYPSPGNYTVQATVTNALGTATASVSRVIASSPSFLSFVTESSALVAPGPHQFGCSNCIVAGEESGSVAIEVERSLDLSRTVSAVATFLGDYRPTVPATSVLLSFGPGETRRSFTVPITDDSVFYGPRFISLAFSDATGGTLTGAAAESRLVIDDDDPRPTLSMSEPRIFIREGEGRTLVSTPVQLTAAMGHDVIANVFVSEGSATYGDYLYAFGFRMPAGETFTTFGAAWIQGDTRPESDEQFTIRLGTSYSPPWDPNFGVVETLVTILNDDAAFLPGEIYVSSGSSETLTIDVGTPYTVPLPITFESTAPNVVPAPAPMVIPAGETTVEVRVSGGANGTAEILATVPDRSIVPAKITVTGAKPAQRRRSTRH